MIFEQISNSYNIEKICVTDLAP